MLKGIYQEKHRELKAVAEHIGLLSACTSEFLQRYHLDGYDSEGVIAEAFTRVCMELALLDINPAIRLHHNPQDATIDCDFYSGGTHNIIEGKTRQIKSTQYPTLDISFAKNDALVEQGGLLFVLCLYDWEWFIWDLSEYEPYRGKWTHKQYTVECGGNYVKTEEKRCFDKSRAKWSGNLGHWFYGEG